MTSEVEGQGSSWAVTGGTGVNGLRKYQRHGPNYLKKLILLDTK